MFSFPKHSGCTLLFEGFCVLLTGIGLALLANQLSPRGLGLARNYFPESAIGTQNHSPENHSDGGRLATNGAASPESVIALRLKQEGFQSIDEAQATRLFDDPRRQQELVVFVDARDDEHYQAGHIPDAFQFDHYQPEKYLLEVLPVCQSAEQVIVYCNGGSCEDSMFAAIMLRDAGVPHAKLLVYTGGITEWSAHQHPVEVGSKSSGQLQASKAAK